MRTEVSVVLAMVLGMGASAVEANPVPDRIAKEFRELVSTTARDGVCPDAETLAEYFGRYQFGLLSPAHRRGIDARFDAFAPILAAAQRAPREPSYRIQRFYRKRADVVQRESMIAALRTWLTAPVTDAPGGGLVRVVFPPEMVAKAIVTARVTAAELLTEWQDADALPLMKAREAEATRFPEMLWMLKRSESRLLDPCVQSLFQTEPDGSLRTCAEPGEATARRMGRNAEALTRGERVELWTYLGNAQVCDDEVCDQRPRDESGTDGVTIYLGNGLVVDLRRAEVGRIQYKDNTTPDRMLHITLLSDPLWQLLTELNRPEETALPHDGVSR